MHKILFFMFILNSLCFGDYFNDKFNEFKKYFLSISSNKVVEYLYDYTGKNGIYSINKYFREEFDYNYDYDDYIYYFTINMPEKISIDNYKRMIKFIETTKKDIQKLLCNDYVFKASLHSNIRLEFKIYDTKYKNTKETIVYNRNSVLACGLL